MRAFLSILGIACGAAAALLALILTGEAMAFVVLALLVATGVLAILVRGDYGLPAGIAIIVLGVLALLFFNPVVGEGDATYFPELPEYFSYPWLATLLLLGTAGVLWVNRAAWGADWVGYGGLGAVAIAILLTFLVRPGEFGGMEGGLNWGIALLAIVGAVACALLLREPVPDAGPGSSSGTATTRHR